LAEAIFEPNVFPINTPTFSTPGILCTYTPVKMEQTECSETLACKSEMPENYPEESIQKVPVSLLNLMLNVAW